jgi:hypothetical protein
MKKIAIITVLFDYPKNYIPTFYKNALKYFIEEDIHIIRKWKEITSDGYYEKLFYYKIVSLLDYIEKKILGKYELVLFLDATDTNFISDPKDIINEFKKMDCSVLLGAEYGLWPPTNFSHLYKDKEKITDKFYLNSGTYIGFTEKIVYHLKDIIEKKYQEGIDDQGRWTIQYLLNNDLKIDQECKIFFSTYLSKFNVEILNDSIKLKNLTASIIHDNGPAGDETIKLTEILG